MFNQSKFCEKCGFKNKSNDKFCGGCGKDLNPKPKKKRNFSEFFFILGFFVVWGNLLDPTFGFDFSGSAEAAGRNFGMFIYYALYFVGGIRTLIKSVKRDRSLESTDKISFWKKYKRSLIITLIGMGSIVILAFTINSHIQSAKRNNPDLVFKDALYGTNLSGDSKFANLMGDILREYQESTKKKFPATLSIDTSNVLEFDSYETKISLQSSISLLQASISELAKADQLLAEVKEEARNKIKNSDLSESDKADVLSGFNNSAGDTNRAYLTKRRYETLKLSYAEILRLYQFLLLNFNDYEIGFDDNNDERIFFTSDKNIEIYNQYLVDIQKASLKFAEAEKSLKDSTDQSLKDKGINITSDDIINSISQ